MNLRIQIPALHPAQAHIVEAARRFNVLECGRRFGKSTLGQNLATLTAIDGYPVGWFAPTYKILAPMWREIERIIDPLVAHKDKSEKYMRLVTGGILEFWSLDDPNAGRSRKYKRVIIDEASLVRDLQDAWDNSIRPTLADLEGDAWFFFTPKGHNYAHQIFAKGQDAANPDGWKSWRFGSADNPHIKAEEIEAARRSLPTTSFEQEWLGIPAPDGGNPFGLDAIRACIAPLSNAAPVVWGWDLGRAEDFTVGVGLDTNGSVCRFERWHRRPWPETRRSIHQYTGQTPALVDSTGLGDVVLQELQEGASNFEGYVFSRPSKQQLMAGLGSAIQQQMIRYPDGSDDEAHKPLVQELESFQYEYSATGVRYSAPPGLHDDCVCALSLAVHAWRQRSGFAAVPDISLTRESPWRM